MVGIQATSDYPYSFSHRFLRIGCWHRNTEEHRRIEQGWYLVVNGPFLRNGLMGPQEKKGIESQRLNPCHWRGFSLLFPIVDVVAFCGGDIFFKVGDAVLNQNVVPGDEFLDVAVLHTLLIPLGKNLCKIVMQFLG